MSLAELQALTKLPVHWLERTLQSLALGIKDQRVLLRLARIKRSAGLAPIADAKLTTAAKGGGGDEEE